MGRGRLPGREESTACAWCSCGVCTANQHIHTHTTAGARPPRLRLRAAWGGGQARPARGGAPGYGTSVTTHTVLRLPTPTHHSILDRASTRPSLPGQCRAPLRAGPAVGGAPPRARPQRAPRRHHARAAPGRICTQTDRNNVICFSPPCPCTFQAKTKDGGTIPSSDDETDGRKKRGRKVHLGCLGPSMPVVH